MSDIEDFLNASKRHILRSCLLFLLFGRLYWQRLVSTPNRILAETHFYEVSANIVHKQEALLAETPKKQLIKTRWMTLVIYVCSL